MIPKPNRDPMNYRPISLLESIGKTFERIINNRLRQHLTNNNLLSLKQFGFHQHRSTQDELNLITNYIRNNTRPRKMTALITKDVEKAFDTVWHDGLRYKLSTQF